MKQLRFDDENQSFQTGLPICQPTIFRCFKLEEGDEFKADNKEYVHFFFLLEGEVKVSGIKCTKSLIMPKEFFFIPNNQFVCRSVKKSKFMLFSINLFHYQANKDMYEDILPVVSELRYHLSPLASPPLLTMFLTILDGYLEDGIVDSTLQDLKQQELFFIFSTLYAKKADYGDQDYGRVSLS